MESLLRPRLLLGLLAPLLLACGETDSVADVLLVATVEVSPDVASIGPQETVQLEATPKTSGGVVLPSRTVTWTSSAPKIVSVSATGMARALLVGGPVSIIATVDGVDGEATISVTPVPVARVTVLPTQVNLSVGGAMQLTATAYDDNGAVLAGRSFFWESTAPSIAPVTTGGMVIAQSDGGPVTVTATAGGKSGSTTVSVAPLPATRLGFVQQPSITPAGNVMVPAVRVAIQDDLLHTVTGATNSVTIALVANAAGATLSGTKTVAAVAGVATFSDLSLDVQGKGFTLLASATGLSSAVSKPFDVAPPPATSLAITTQPPALALADSRLSPRPVVQLRDAQGNDVDLSGVPITAAMASGPSNGSLGGTTTVATNGSGAATFGNLKFNRSGTYTIKFSSPGLGQVVSNPILVP